MEKVTISVMAEAQTTDVLTTTIMVLLKTGTDITAIGADSQWETERIMDLAPHSVMENAITERAAHAQRHSHISVPATPITAHREACKVADQAIRSLRATQDFITTVTVQ